MKPRLYQVDEGKGGIARSELHEKAVGFVEERYPRTGEVPFLWIIDDGHSLLWIETPWEDDREKIASYKFVALALEASRARAYTSIAEVWIAGQKAAPDGSYPEEALPPCERPESERDDAILIVTYERTGPFGMTRFICKPQSKLLGVRVDESSDDDRMRWGGQMFNLFERGRRMVQKLMAMIIKEPVS
ncbi:hypothetical protein [Sinorhizobium fredii]|uniref:hypothetical protein n=1 Tax=Rhizobium fredii TaxID=380 RepID=UPI0004B8765A|nr:hypothetical protein [Sinorhizobium fredii]